MAFLGFAIANPGHVVNSEAFLPIGLQPIVSRWSLTPRGYSRSNAWRTLDASAFKENGF
jgi:hypothetical protein